MSEWIGLISLLVGLAARIVVPWLAVRQQDPENAAWSWRFVWPMLLSFGIVVLLLPLIIQDLESIRELPYQAAWLVGWGAADIGRKAYKMISKEAE